ncbi:MAG: FAD-dependent oxidoreductase [Thermodesulfobacteriota bacterium]|nr:FAD-dependent oxidoreductase [Thermodesulfobacteriota bacterium]
MDNKPRFKKLFEPGQIGKMVVRNRIVMPAMAGMGPTLEGFVTEKTKGFYEARAKGGVGLIIIGNTPVNWALGRSGKYRILIEDDRFLPGLSEVAEVIHKHGAKAAVQINHAGPSAFIGNANLRPIASSAVPRPPDHVRADYPPPKEMTIAEIEETVDAFARAAGRAQKASFDGIEIHAAHRYLLNSFLSPYYNRRQDKYGGDLKNRARFLLEVVIAVREVVGKDYPVWCRMSGKEGGVKGGITPELAAELAQMLEKTGQIDALDVTQWPPVELEPIGFALPWAAEVKKVVNIPVIGVGMIDTELAERALREKKVDFIAMGRRLIADPELPHKAASGRLDDIAPCQRCNNCQALLECTVNASFLKEYEYEIKPAEKIKKVLVVGGGPGGMEAARVAALRGHHVVLYERGRRLGGQLALASVLREQGEALTNYLATQIRKLGVKVELGKEVDPTFIKEIKPDAIVLATGSTSSTSAISGIDKDSVVTATDIGDMMQGYLKRVRGGFSFRRSLWYVGMIIMKVFGPSTIRRLLRLYAPFGKKVAVMGLKLHSVEIAHFMAQSGKKVIIVDAGDKIPEQENAVHAGETTAERPMPQLRARFIQGMLSMGVPILLGVKYEEITPKGLVVRNKQGERQTIEADTIIAAAIYRPNTELFKSLNGIPTELHLVGDCHEPVGILEAIHDGSRIGRIL